jgi:hypothetical protein
MAVRQSTLDFEPDLSQAGFASSGPTMEALDVKNKLWPGGPLPPDYEYQFIEGEYMKEDMIYSSRIHRLHAAPPPARV